MKKQLVQDELSELASVPGVRACALVEGASGLVWQSAGAEPVMQSLWEAAAEYWRLHRRIGRHFDELGPLHVAVMHHDLAMLVVMPCAEELDLIAVCVAVHRGVDWRDWQRRLDSLGEKLKSS